MIYYLIDNLSSHPEVSLETPPHGLLNEAERTHFDALRMPKRRHDWLLGRWTAKHLLQAVVAQERGEYRPFDFFTIANSPSGAPLVNCPGLANLLLSISHRDDYGFCAVAPYLAGRRAGGLGADIERVEPRSPAFVQDYFTPDEIAQVKRAPDNAHDQIVAALWSAKEAALKALQLGLTVDTRSVSSSGIEPRTGCSPAWTRFELCCRGQTHSETVELVGWWRTWNDYVLTLVAESVLCASSDDLVQVA